MSTLSSNNNNDDNNDNDELQPHIVVGNNNNNDTIEDIVGQSASSNVTNNDDDVVTGKQQQLLLGNQLMQTKTQQDNHTVSDEITYTIHYIYCLTHTNSTRNIYVFISDFDSDASFSNFEIGFWIVFLRKKVIFIRMLHQSTIMN